MYNLAIDLFKKKQTMNTYLRLEIRVVLEEFLALDLIRTF